MRDLPAELDAAEQDVLFSRRRVRIAQDALAADLARLIEVQEAIEHEGIHKEAKL